MCVETLKRDWSSTLRLRDVLLTISCLLIQPNPASALNEAAGKLASEDWEAFVRRAKLMTEIHAAIPANIVDEVREAQSRGDEKEVQAEAKGVEAKLNGKGKGKARSTPATAKAKASSAAEDEENMLRQRNDTQEVESDPEGDWIPDPAKSAKTTRVSRSNVFGIHGLEDDMDSPEKPRVSRSFPKSTSAQEKENDADISDPFITIPPKHKHAHHRTNFISFRVPSSSGTAAADTSQALVFSDKNSFAPIQPNNRTHTLLNEFSWSWAESEIMHNTGSIKDGESKSAVRKRLASDDFEKKQAWELKKFKKAGCDLKRYNRGDFGPRTGMNRL